MKKILFFIHLYLLISQGLAFEVKNVNVSCDVKESCIEVKNRLSGLRSRYNSLEHLSEVIKIYAQSENFDYFSYNLEDKESNFELNIDIKPRQFIKSFEIKASDRSFVIPLNLPLKSDEYFDRNKYNETIEILKRQAFSNGYTKVKIDETKTKTENGLQIVFNIQLLDPKILKQININVGNKFIHKYVENKLSNFLNKPFDLQAFRLEIDNVKNQLFELGYYTLDLELQPVKLKDNQVYLSLDVSPGNLIIFNVLGDKIYDTVFFKDVLKNYIRTNRRTPRKDIVKTLMLEYYKKIGFLDTQIEIANLEYKNLLNEEVIKFDIKTKLGQRYKIGKLNFNGANKFSNKKILNYFYENATELVVNNIYDLEYLQNFSELLKKNYIGEGFLLSTIERPEFNIDNINKIVDVEYKIREGTRAVVSNFDIMGIPQAYIINLKKTLLNKVGDSFNPLVFEEDLNVIIDFLGDKGYYYALIKNKNLPNLLNYSTDLTKLDIKIEIELGPQLILDEVIIVGNRKTKNSFILKNVHIVKGQRIKPLSLKNIQTRLTNTGLFSSVKVEPIRSSIAKRKTDLLVQVFEKDFGVMEIAPGFRTDIGLKLSGTVTYNNIAGVNRTLSLKGQVNQRLNYNTFDKRRRNEQKSMLEYAANVNLMERFFLDSQMNYNVGISTSRKRFYSFDADIVRISNTVSQDLNNEISTSLRHQFENISQFDASEERDNGEFKIGAITPSLTLDYRDNRINTRKGVFSNWSCEWADPMFLSQKTEDLEINYYKLVSRNRFYVPYPNGKGVLALSLTAGLEQNLARGEKLDENGNTVLDDNGQKMTEGYIPNIKVFRLSGTDIVRGYDEDEINRLITNEDISNVTVNDKAYLLNLKVEPRYFLNDSMILGVFYDAGRVYVNEVETDELRSSVGFSFKYLTPVGSLDFDYGIKTLRKREPDGSMESPGRLHVSIGFF
jgi:outer membrane protein insertion porin family